MELIRKTRTEITKNGDKIRYAIFKCPECLQEVERQMSNGLKAKSCGCIKSKGKNNSNYKHGYKNTKLYDVWSSMKHRCLNLKATSYKDYGGRGITICNEWLEFIPFRDWSLNNGYADNLQINRINNNGNYEPTNCNWITHSENMKNRRKPKTEKLTSEIANKIRELYIIEGWTQKQLAEKYNVSIALISSIINNKRWRNL